MKSTLVLLAAFLGTASGAFAADTTAQTDTVNGLVYTITASEATLVGPANPEEFAGSGSTRTTLTIPNEVNGVKVTTIAPNAFKDATGISRVVFPSELHDIGASAFRVAPV